ncbi:hypothetical protein GGS21DRAFT_541012 [Xylaria nigripes]|nr:hypothetical protein GGS21DRAFT_541012 [Xylaria nigripes]
MADVLAETPDYHGSLVAFEGPRDIISTQLRLLPSSPNLLVLPPVQSFFSKENADTTFDARSYILETHEACDARAEIARAFLRGASPDSKRLVFLNGGTASAHMSCISAISKCETNGDTAAAETIYNRLIQNGVAGLKRNSTPGEEFGNSMINGVTEMDDQDEEFLDDPISTAMRAADRLDRETAFLQDNSYVFDLTDKSRSRSLSVPAIPLANDEENDMPCYYFSASENNTEAPQPQAQEPNHLIDADEAQTSATPEDQSRDPSIESQSSSCLGDVHSTDPRTPSTPGSPYARLESAPSSPILLGEALIVDIRPSFTPRHERIRSVDRIYATAVKNEDILLRNFHESVLAKPEESRGSPNNILKKEDDSPKKPDLRSNFHNFAPCPTIAKPNKTMMRKKTPPPLKLEVRDLQQPTSYAIRGSDSGRDDAHFVLPDDLGPNISAKKTEHCTSFLDLCDDVETVVNSPFETVLPMTENLVILFKSEETEPKLEAMVQALKNGTFPATMPPLLPRPNAFTERLDTPSTRSSTRKLSRQNTQESQQPIEEEPMPLQEPEEYDLFAYYGEDLRSPTLYSSRHDTYSQSQATLVVSTPPTPAQTPPPELEKLPKRIFHEFDIRACKTAVCIQNPLRSILNLYFSPEHTGYQQFNFPLLPELGSFWKPIFREIASGSPKTARKTDLILAIGAQKSSGKDLMNMICSSLDKLGKRPHGEFRSGRLDMRYLIANAMQAFTSQPLASQTQDNPFSNPILLATLIIPHLETYIAAHPTTRFLILEYSSNYLSTILALQHLIGIDLMKITGIVDSDATESKSYCTRSPQIVDTKTHATKTAASTRNWETPFASNGSQSEVEVTEKNNVPQSLFSKADFILPSTASEFEIATFISNIWRILINTSALYIPNNTQSPDANCIPRYISSSSSNCAENQYPLLFRAASMLGFVPTLEQQPQHLGAPQNYRSSSTFADFPVPRPRIIAHSRSSNALHSAFHSNPAPRIPRPLRHQRSKLLHLLGREFTGVSDTGPSENINLYPDLEDEDERRFTAEERKYMPLWSHQGGPRKGNSRKALKWLGLAT